MTEEMLWDIVVGLVVLAIGVACFVSVAGS
jgi:hypothetical protein